MNLDELDDATLSARESELLAAAIDARDVELLDRLLVRGVYPDAPPSLTVELVGCPGWRLMEAASSMSRDVEMLRLLIQHGADPHTVTQLGWNVLHAAVDVNAEANRPESVTSILTYLHALGVDTRQRDHRGMTPLARAGMLGTELEVEVLRGLGCSKRR